MFTDADLASVDAALLRGQLEVEYADRRVRYHSISELRQLRQAIVDELRQAQTSRPRQYFARAGKGLSSC